MPTSFFFKVIIFFCLFIYLGFPGGSMVKNLPAMQEMQVRALGQEDPLEKEWQPTPVFLTGKSHRQRGLVSHSLWGLKESDMTERPNNSNNIFIWLHWVLVAACRVLFPDQEQNLDPLHWEPGVLVTGSPGKFPVPSSYAFVEHKHFFSGFREDLPLWE